MHNGEISLIAMLDRAAKVLGWDDPCVKELLEIELRIARNEVGYRGRHIGERLRAAERILDRLGGRPREMPPAQAGGDGPVIAEWQDVDGVGLHDPAPAPTSEPPNG